MGARLCFVVMVACLSWSCASTHPTADLEPVKQQIPMALWAADNSAESLVGVINDNLYVNDKLVGKLPQPLSFKALLKILEKPLRAERANDKSACLFALGDGADVQLISYMHHVCSYNGFKSFKLSYVGFRLSPGGPALHFKDDFLAVNHWSRPLDVSHEKILGVDVEFLKSGYALYVAGKLIKGDSRCGELVTACGEDVEADVGFMLSAFKEFDVGDDVPVVLNFKLNEIRDVGRVVRVLNRIVSKFNARGGLVISDKVLGGEGVGDHDESLEASPVLRSGYVLRLNQCVAYDVQSVLESAEDSIIRCLSKSYKEGERAFGRWKVSFNIDFDGVVSSVKNEEVVEGCKVFLGCFNDVIKSLDFKGKAMTGKCSVRKAFVIHRHD